jgi:hypothetical protein
MWAERLDEKTKDGYYAGAIDAFLEEPWERH